MLKIGVLVIYSHIKNYPNFHVLKQHLLFTVYAGQESG